MASRHSMQKWAPHTHRMWLHPDSRSMATRQVGHRTRLPASEPRYSSADSSLDSLARRQLWYCSHDPGCCVSAPARAGGVRKGGVECARIGAGQGTAKMEEGGPTKSEMKNIRNFKEAQYRSRRRTPHIACACKLGKRRWKCPDPAPTCQGIRFHPGKGAGRQSNEGFCGRNRIFPSEDIWPLQFHQGRCQPRFGRVHCFHMDIALETADRRRRMQFGKLHNPCNILRSLLCK
mmetsp:Transcript_2471/g.6725  ORF Transcript_2471/g.6725 Transcript_2471/m.6725 type:complete len:233 (-) Transcript_2471:351-1049(-)